MKSSIQLIVPAFHLFQSFSLSTRQSQTLLRPNTSPLMENSKSNDVADAGRFHSEAQALLNKDPAGGWEKCWEQGQTPWDLGDATPVIRHLVQTDSLPKGRALVPGCGTGYDVVAMASPERYVVGLDISETATKIATKKFSSSPNAEHFSFQVEDFFTWKPSEPFDLIFDYTFFCALDLHMRPLWAKRMYELLNEGGELLTLMFPMDDHVGGPPFAVSVSDYEEVLLPLGFTVISIEDNEHAEESRKGIEKVGRWKKSSV